MTWLKTQQHNNVSHVANNSTFTIVMALQPHPPAEDQQIRQHPILPDINDPHIQKIVARVSKNLRHENTAEVNLKTATLFLMKMSSTLSSELCQSLRWGDSSRQDSLTARLKRVHRDLVVLRGRSKEAAIGANAVLLAAGEHSATNNHQTKTSYAHTKGGKWLVLAKQKNKKRNENDRLVRLRQGEIDAARTLSPIFSTQCSTHLNRRPHSASRSTRRLNTHPNASPIRHRQRPQSAQSPLRHHGKQFQSNHVVAAGSTASFERLQRNSSDVLKQLQTELKHASNDGLHGKGGNLLNDPAAGTLVKKLSQMYGTLYAGVHGKLNLLLEE